MKMIGLMRRIIENIARKFWFLLNQAEMMGWEFFIKPNEHSYNFNQRILYMAEPALFQKHKWEQVSKFFLYFQVELTASSSFSPTITTFSLYFLDSRGY